MRARSRRTSGERSAGASGMPGTEHDIRIRSAASTHIIISLFVWPLAISYALLGATKADSAWLVLALICAVGFVLHFYFAYLQLTISQGILNYRTLFSRRSLALRDITRSEFQHNKNRRDPRRFLAIVPSNGESILRINLKPFRREDIRRLLAIPEIRLAKR